MVNLDTRCARVHIRLAAHDSGATVVSDRCRHIRELEFSSGCPRPRAQVGEGGAKGEDATASHLLAPMLHPGKDCTHLSFLTIVFFSEDVRGAPKLIYWRRQRVRAGLGTKSKRSR